MCANGTLVEDKMCRFKSECAHFNFNKRPVYTHDGAREKFSTNSHETDNSVGYMYTRGKGELLAAVFLSIKSIIEEFFPDSHMSVIE